MLLHAFEVVAGIVNLYSIAAYTRKYWPYLHHSAGGRATRPVSPDAPEEADGTGAGDEAADPSRLEGLTLMAAGLAHDFNNLLAAILGNVTVVLRRLSADSPARSSAEQIESTALRALELTHEIMTYSGRIELSKEKTELGRLIDGMKDTLRVTVAKNVDIEYRIVDGVPPVFVDQDRIREAVVGLVSNASDFIYDECGKIIVSVGQRDCDRQSLGKAWCEGQLPEGKYVFVEVSDSGCGVPDAVERRIFDPFFTTKIRAQGMGLAVVLGIARAHGGGVNVESVPGEGSTFTILLPPAPSEAGE